jgi:hypothetical protein
MPDAETPRPRRVKRRPDARAPKRLDVQTDARTDGRMPKCRDAGKSRVTLYLDVQTAEKLAVASIMRRVDQSDIANEVLTAALSSIAFYDRTRKAEGPATPSDRVQLADVSEAEAGAA